MWIPLGLLAVFCVIIVWGALKVSNDDDVVYREDDDE